MICLSSYFFSPPYHRILDPPMKPTIFNEKIAKALHSYMAPKCEEADKEKPSLRFNDTIIQ